MDSSFYNTSESYSKYLREIGKFPLLTPEQERSLVDKIRDKELEEKERLKARDKLVSSNLRLVISVAKCSHCSNFLLEDLVSSGNIGLVKAIEKYDYNKGMKFASYARWFVQREVMFEVNRSSDSILIPPNISKILRRLSRFDENTSSPEELSEASGIPLDKVNHALNYKLRTRSLNRVVGEDDEEVELMDFVYDYRYSPEKMSKISEKEIFEVVLPSCNSEKEITILGIRYGLDGEGYKTFEEVGIKLDLSRQRIEQIEKRIFNRIRNNPKVLSKLKPYLQEDIGFNEVLG